MWQRLDYLQEMTSRTRKVSVVLLMLGMCVSILCLALAVASVLIDVPKKPWGAIVGCIAIFSVLSFASTYMFVRLARDLRAANGRTNMPEWFIQGFGLVFLIGMCFVAYVDGNPLLLLEGLAVTFAMRGIRKLLHARDDAAGDDGASES